MIYRKLFCDHCLNSGYIQHTGHCGRLSYLPYWVGLCIFIIASLAVGFWVSHSNKSSLSGTHTHARLPLINDKVSQTEKMLSLVISKCIGRRCRSNSGRVPIFISEALKRNWQFSENGIVEEMFIPKSAQSAHRIRPIASLFWWTLTIAALNVYYQSSQTLPYNTVVFVCPWVCATKRKLVLCVWIGCIHTQI